MRRRDFLKGVAAGAAVGIVGGGLAGYSVAPTPEVYWKLPYKWDLEADVVVLGFGAAGAAAAIEAASKDASVIVLDKAATPGGTTLMSGASMHVWNSEVQEAKGMHVDVQEEVRLEQEALKRSHWEQPYPQRIFRFVTTSGQEVGDWLEELGMTFASVSPSSLRGEGGGAGLTSLLRDVAESKGIAVQTETEAVQLVARPDSKMVLGVVAEAGGAELFVKALRGVVNACGGFSASKEMLKLSSPVGYAAIPMTAETSTGDGIRLAQALGAALSGMHIAGAPPAVLEAGSRMQYYGRRISAIFVNERGNRFCDEGGPSREINEAVFLQLGSHAWLITDSTQVAESKGSGIHSSFSDDLSNEVSAGMVMAAESIEDLAEAIEVDPENLRTTVETWNSWAKTEKKDRGYGRVDKPTFTFSTIEGPIFYAVELVPCINETLGGLVADAESRVIDAEGIPVPRLYAAGDVVREGAVSTIGEALFFGKLAGRNAASESPWA
ncbi:MAG: FAD-dependent oxidoreductase [Candidatus Geothermarchaeales archaeon]